MISCCLCWRNTGPTGTRLLGRTGYGREYSARDPSGRGSRRTRGPPGDPARLVRGSDLSPTDVVCLGQDPRLRSRSHHNRCGSFVLVICNEQVDLASCCRISFRAPRLSSGLLPIRSRSIARGIVRFDLLLAPIPACQPKRSMPHSLEALVQTTISGTRTLQKHPAMWSSSTFDRKLAISGGEAFRTRHSSARHTKERRITLHHAQRDTS